MTEVLLGTKKGLFVLDGSPGDGFEVAARAFAGEPVEYAMRDPRSGRVVASVTSAFYGPKLWVAEDPSGEWEQASGVELPEGGDEALQRVRRADAGGGPGAATRSACQRVAGDHRDVRTGHQDQHHREDDERPVRVPRHPIDPTTRRGPGGRG